MSQKHSMCVDTETAIEELLKLVVLSEHMQENLNDLQSYCKVGGSSVLWNQLQKFCELIIPRPKQSLSFVDQLLSCTRHIKCYIDSELSVVVGTTYHDLRQFVGTIDLAAFFNCSFAGSQLSDVSSPTNLAQCANVSDNNCHLSGDDADDSVIAFLNDVEKVEAAASDVNKLPAVLHADRVVPVNSVQLTFANFQCQRGRAKSGRPTSCSYCGKQFLTPSALTVHIRIHTGHRPFVCSQCPRTFKQSCHLKRHIHHRHAASKLYVCAYCHKAFAAAPLLRRHLQTHGMVTRAPARNSTCYSCEVCGLKIAKRHLFNRHLRIHNRERHFLCSECGRSFADASSFHRHQRSHLPAMAVTCPMCDKMFRNTELLRQHQRTHSSMRPHVCTVCHRGFKRLGDLRAHSRIHSGLRPYTCKLCPAAFTQSSSLRYHMQVHTDERRYTCSVCSRHFRAADKLRIHLLIHSGEQPHKCDRCGRNFRDLSAFKRHVKTHAPQAETS